MVCIDDNFLNVFKVCLKRIYANNWDNVHMNLIHKLIMRQYLEFIIHLFHLDFSMGDFESIVQENLQIHLYFIDHLILNKKKILLFISIKFSAFIWFRNRL